MVNSSNLVTAVITTSPLYGHPSTDVIDAAYESIRYHLPNIRTLILMDGVRPEQLCWKERYEEYKTVLKNSMEWKDRFPWFGCNASFIEFNEFKHQAGMIRDALKNIHTPLILWVEHDLQLLKEPIQWDQIGRLLLDKEVFSVRFLMDDVRKSYYERGTIEKYGVTLTKTVEYSSLPNIARKDLYEFIVPHFDKAQIHLECNNICGLFHKDDCKNWPLALYTPPDGKPRAGSRDGRSFGLARTNGPKLPMRF